MFWRVFAAAGITATAAIGVPALTATAANAVTDTACTASLAGLDALTATSPSSAIAVDKGASVVAVGGMSSGPVTYDVKMEFAGFSWTVASGSSAGNTWTDTLEVKKYSKYGVGIYKVKIDASNAAGDTCVITAYVKVKGGFMSGTAGKIGVGALGVGGLAMVGSALASLFSKVAGARRFFRFGWK